MLYSFSALMIPNELKELIWQLQSAGCQTEGRKVANGVLLQLDRFRSVFDMFSVQAIIPGYELIGEYA